MTPHTSEIETISMTTNTNETERIFEYVAEHKDFLIRLAEHGSIIERATAITFLRVAEVSL